MIPFTQPYTAPDGTTRRPLSERVPELSSAALDGLRLDQSDINDGPLVDRASAALWRVAVEDWLIRVGCETDWTKYKRPGPLHDSGVQFYVRDDRDRVLLVWRCGISMPESLNIAAHDMADAMNIAP